MSSDDDLDTTSCDQKFRLLLLLVLVTVAFSFAYVGVQVQRVLSAQHGLLAALPGTSPVFEPQVYAQWERTWSQLLPLVVGLALVTFLAIGCMMAALARLRCRDAAQRRMAESALSHSERRFKQLADLLPQVVFETDSAGRLTYANQRAHELFGYDDVSQWQGRPAVEMLAPSERPRALQNIARALRGEPSEAHEYSALRRDGTTFPVLIYSTAIVENERPAGIRGVVVDISERKRVEDELRASRERLAQIAELTRELIWEVDAEGRYTYVSRACRSLLGYAEEDVVGKLHFYDLHPEEGREEFRQAAFEIFARKQPFVGLPNPVVTADGRVLTVLSNGIPLLDENGELVGYRGSDIDITEQLRAEQRFRVLFESSRDAIMTLAPPDWRFTSGNPATLALFGVESETQFTALTLWDLSPERQPDGTRSSDKARAMIEQAMREGSAYFEWTHRRLDGHEFPTTVLLTRMEVAGEAMLQATVRDITEQKRAEERVAHTLADLRVLNRELELARQQAEDANRLKSEFLANTSHEIRTPLNGIIGYLQLVLNGLYDSEEEQRQFLQGAMESARHLLGLINDVLDVAKIEAGKLSITPQPVALAGVLAEVHSLVRVQAEQAGLQLVFPAVAENLRVWCDADRFKQVMLNLLSNAFKFTPRGGQVTVQAQRREHTGDVRIIVQDTGIGIPPDKIDLVFDKFVQVDGSTTRQRGGSGLGLTISRRLVEMMGGVMGAASAGENQGATFYFTLPLYRGGEQTLLVTEESARLGLQVQGDPDAPLVLVVEDDPEYRRLLCALLHKHGYATIWAGTADDALEAVRRCRPAAVTLDYSLPCREGARLNTGWDVLVELLRDRETRDIPCFLITGDEQVIWHRLRSEPLPSQVVYLDKGEVNEKLGAAIQGVLGSTQQVWGRLLLVDDDPAFTGVVSRLLQRAGHQVEVVRSGSECVRYLRRRGEEVRLVLLDLKMPGMSGYDVLRELKQLPLIKRPPVLVVTAYPEPDNLADRLALASGGVVSLLSKETALLNPEALCARIARYLAAA